MTQYVAVEFKPGGKTFTYANDGAEVFPGDRVKVPDRYGDGWKAVTVVSVTKQTPPFPCKPILGRVEDANEPDALDILDSRDLDIRADELPF